MEDTPKQDPTAPVLPPRKACQITLMFPVEDDAFALKVKAAFDDVVKDIKEKRYNFSINEA